MMHLRSTSAVALGPDTIGPVKMVVGNGSSSLGAQSDAVRTLTSRANQPQAKLA